MIKKTFELLGFRCQAIFNDISGIPITFLHGYSFTSDVWDKLGILQLLEEKKIPFLAIDMPYGLKSKCSPKSRRPEQNVRVLREALNKTFGTKRSILVGASLGGYIALRYSLKYPIQGMLLVAPVRSLSEELVQKYPELTIPVYIVYGTRDNIVSSEDMRNLSDRFLNSKLVVYEDAKHPAYLDKPEEFKRHLLEIHEISDQSGSRV